MSKKKHFYFCFEKTLGCKDWIHFEDHFMSSCGPCAKGIEKTNDIDLIKKKCLEDYENCFSFNYFPDLVIGHIFYSVAHQPALYMKANNSIYMTPMCLSRIKLLFLEFTENFFLKIFQLICRNV